MLNQSNQFGDFFWEWNRDKIDIACSGSVLTYIYIKTHSFLLCTKLPFSYVIACEYNLTYLLFVVSGCLIKKWEVYKLLKLENVELALLLVAVGIVRIWVLYGTGLVEWLKVSSPLF